jgi:hypothetical protein
MGRKPKIKLEWNGEDNRLNSLRTIDLEKLKMEAVGKYKSIVSSLSDVYSLAQELYQQQKVDEEILEEKGLLSLQDAYDYLREKGYHISFRAFGGRVERGNIPSIKIGKKRYIPIEALEHLLELQNKFYSIKEAYEKYREYDPSLSFRAFIGRVEKGAIPSIKVGGRRLIPKEVGDAFVVLAKDYYTVSQALAELSKHGIKIRRNAFERRLDRGRIPFVKVGGKRYIPSSVLQQLIEQEKALQQKK